MVSMRAFWATVLVAGCLAMALIAVIPASAEPDNCPPLCDQIPETAWIHRHAVPLDSVYNWPALPGSAVSLTGTVSRFRFEDLCGARAVPQDARDSAVAARVTAAHPDSPSQLHAQGVPLRGASGPGGGRGTA